MHISRKEKSVRVLTASLLAAFLVLGFFSNGSNVSAAAYPAQVLNLTNWKETLPTGQSSSPTEIVQASLGAFSVSPYFQVNAAGNGVQFRAPVNGVTTSGSGYPRSELREMTNNGQSNASWSTTSGTHGMYIDEAITAVPQKKPQIVAGQIHDANDDVIVIRLDYPNLHVDINGTAGPTLDPHYTLGKRFQVVFLSSNGQIKIYYNGGTTPAYTLNKSASGLYFKAGAYTQSNCSKETTCSSGNFGEVMIYNLAVQHSSSTNATLTSVMTPATSTPAPTPTQTPTPTLTPIPTPMPVPTPTTLVSATALMAGTPFEAESGTLSGGMAVISNDSTASGQKYVQANSSGSVTYQINVLVAGKYQLAGWIEDANGSSNSFKVKMDSSSTSTWSLNEPVTSWTEDLFSGKTYTLSAGVHTLKLKYREAGAKIDQLELIKQ